MPNRKGRRKALVIVAHCDDAVLWMGGAVHRLGDWAWHIFSLCDGEGGTRSESFYRSCEALGTEKCNAFDFQDYSSGGSFSRNKKAEMVARLAEHIDATYDYVFSHSLQAWNEYGHHDNHQEAGLVASEIATECSWPLVQFCYRPIYGAQGIATVADDKRADYYCQLDYEELQFKLKLIVKCFPCEAANLNNLGYPCPNPEAFAGISLPAPFVRGVLMPARKDALQKLRAQR